MDQKRICHHPRRKARQEQAAARQEARNSRSTEEQFALMELRRGFSKKEWRRLSDGKEA